MAETLPGQNLDRHPGRLILPERHEMPLVVDRCERTRPINGCETIVVALAITQTDIPAKTVTPGPTVSAIAARAPASDPRKKGEALSGQRTTTGRLPSVCAKACSVSLR